MLAKACDKFLPQNKKIQNRKTMVTTWHRALEHLSQTLQKNYHQHIENDINSKKVFPEKSITEFPKKSPSETTLFERISRMQMNKNNNIMLAMQKNISPSQ